MRNVMAGFYPNNNELPKIKSSQEMTNDCLYANASITMHTGVWYSTNTLVGADSDTQVIGTCAPKQFFNT